MSSVRRLTVVPPDPAALRRPESFANLLRRVPVSGRGRSLAARRRIEAAPVIERLAAMDWWADMVLRRCGSAERIAVVFGVTFQTGCNWLNRISCPTGDKVLMAVAMWPEEFGLDAGETARAA
jgi:hypothetical protein